MQQGPQTEIASEAVPEVLGRDSELATIDGFLDSEAAALLIAGEPGIGKTMLWRAALRKARDRGWRVLVAVPAEPEAQLSFAALGDLLAAAVGETSSRLSAPQRHALEVALMLRPAEGSPPDPRAVALATTAVLQALAAEGPVVVAVDDSQWLDRPSADALAFALRRSGAAGVRTIVTCRSAELVESTPLALDRTALRIEVGPLSFGATHRLLSRTVGGGLTHSVARRLHESSHGNPLHALELRRALEPHRPWTPEAFAPPPALAELVRRRLAELPDGTQQSLQFVAAMSRPTLDLLRVLRPSGDERDVNAAIEAGLLTMEGTRLRFAHPLFASACYRAVPAARRREVHACLAEVVTDPELRARHLALSTDRPCADVAAALDVGVHQARARGAPHVAAELADLARAFTPAADAAGRYRRTRTAARCLLEAGESALARRTLEEYLVDLPQGRERARTLVALAAVLFEEDGVGATRATAQQAIAAAGDDLAARAEVHLAIAERAQLPAAESLDHAERALRFLDADPVAEPELLATALREVALSRYHLGQGMDRDLIARATAAEQQLAWPPAVAWRARTCMGECLKYLDFFAEAEGILLEGERVAEAEGDIGSLCEIAGHRAELSLWLGRWTTAEQQAARAVDMAQLSEQRGRIGVATGFRSLVHAHRGRVEPARADGMTALEEGVRGDDIWEVMLARSALAFLDLSVGDAVGARAHLAAVDAYAETELLTQPRQWRYLGDYVEALVRCGALDVAADRLQRLQHWASGMGTASAAAVAARATGLVEEAAGNREAATGSLHVALKLYDGLPLPFERGRTLLALGMILRRARRRRDARDSLQQALSVFTSLDAPLWAEQTRSELARISGRTSTADELTVNERRVAELVVKGMSNKQVASALVVTPRTVEAHLSRVYAKLGVRSRMEMARRLG